MMVDEDLASSIEKYIDYLRAGGARPRTVTARLAGVNLMTGRSADRDPRRITRDELTVWLAAEGLAAWSRATYFGHARAWFEFLVETGRRDDNPLARMKRPKVPRGLPRPLTKEQVSAVLALAGPRPRLYILLAGYAGLRVHEIAQLRGEHVSETTLLVRDGKGGKTAPVPTHPLIWAAAADMPAVGWWFPSSTARSGHVVPGSVSTGVRRALLRAGIDGHAHQLRHFFGTEVLRAAGGNLRVAQELLRHSSPATTAIYTLVDDQETRSAVMGLPDATVPFPTGTPVRHSHLRLVRDPHRNGRGLRQVGGAR